MILYRFLYAVFIIIYLGILRLASLWNPKAKLWVSGRKDILKKIQADLSNNQAPIVWMHCSSLGEFEQGRPLLEKLRIHYPDHRLLLTFFSPSGYTVIKPKPVADYIYYLPFGSRLTAARFIDLLKPRLVFWIKYDYWFYYLHELKKRSIPVLLISGNFRRTHPFFKWYGMMHRYMLTCFTQLFVQTKFSRILLKKIGVSRNVSVTGDTRFDRVVEIAEQFEPIEVIERFCNNDKVVVAGSTWAEDEEVLDHYANAHPEVKVIIAPHEIHESHLHEIEQLFKRTIRFSVYKSQLQREINSGGDSSVTSVEGKNVNQEINVLIIDNIGMLSRLYRYATIAYVGGGFGEQGVHNILEAAVYGKPVVFGPVFNKYIEAMELLEESGAYTIQTALELESMFNELFTDHELYNEVCKASRNYVYAKKGATEKIMQYIQENRLLTR